MRSKTAAVLVAAALVLAGCASSYKTRMAHLDLNATRGLEYRAQLERQGTTPTRAACKIGFDLLQDNPPDDMDGGGDTEEWQEQTEEAFVKACMTGGPRPKPDPSGINAVTPVPHASRAAG